MSKPAATFATDAPVSSPRRRHIVETLLDVMARDGDVPTMRALAQEAQVAVGTLYNLFGGQEALLAEAVALEMYERVGERPANTGEKGLIADHLARLAAATQESLRVPAYAKAMTRIYFTAAQLGPVRRALEDIPAAQLRTQLDTAAAAGQVADWVDTDALARLVVTAQYGVFAKWGMDEISDAGLLPALRRTCLTVLIGALQGQARQDALTALAAER